VLDFNATDDPVHGDQDGKFFHGYYRSCCYPPLYVTCGGHVLVARLRTSDRDAAQGSTEVLAARATSSPKPNTCAKAPIHASSSPTCPTAAPTYAPSTKTTTARVARWKTGSKNNNSIPSPTAPALTTSVPTSCACGSPQPPTL